MALVPLIPIDLDKPRQLLFDRRAVKRSEVELSRAWGRPYTFYAALQDVSLLVVTQDMAHLSFINISVLVWVGLLHEDATLTLETVEEALPAMDLAAMITYAGKILQAWQATSPPPLAQDNGEAPDEADPLEPSHGESSGRLNALALA